MARWRERTVVRARSSMFYAIMMFECEGYCKGENGRDSTDFGPDGDGEGLRALSDELMG